MARVSSVRSRKSRESTHGSLRQALSGAPRRIAAASRRVEGVIADVDLGMANEHSTKTTLARKVNGLLDEQRLSQNAAAQRLGMPQSKVSAIRNYKLHGISLERLMQALIALNQRVEIVVTPGVTSPDRAIAVVM